MRDHNDITVDESGMSVFTSNVGDVYITTEAETIDISSLTLGDTVTITGSTTSSDSYIYDSGTIDLDSLSITLNDPVEFEDTMPDVAKVEDMCNDYPALRKAYENFKTIYKMVHQDWQGKQDDDEHFPF
jgi:hypothetical protein